jgi:hypothetical protein
MHPSVPAPDSRNKMHLTKKTTDDVGTANEVAIIVRLSIVQIL